MIVNAEAIKRDVIVVGTSAGGVETLSRLLSMLPSDLGAIVGIVLHRSPIYNANLGKDLARYSALPLIEPVAEQPLQLNTIYLAPADRHIIFESGVVKVSRGPTEHRVRPAIDVLFRSAAAAYGQRVVGVVLSGMGHDGTAGLRAIKAACGLALVQAPSDALLSGMPSHALEHMSADLILLLQELPATFLTLAKGQPVRSGARA